MPAQAPGTHNGWSMAKTVRMAAQQMKQKHWSRRATETEKAVMYDQRKHASSRAEYRTWPTFKVWRKLLRKRY